MGNKNSSAQPTYIVAGIKPWNRRIFETQISDFPGRWFYVDEASELTASWLEEINPVYVFFLHWSEIVPEEILDAQECVCFHMTDVPYGRGGSPLQNLIVRGHRETKMTALRMVSELDAGPVYMKRALSLEGSTAEEVFVRSSQLSAKMIREIIEERPEPVPQSGQETTFKRRTPSESEIPVRDSMQALHDFIRMLDAQGYPSAFIEHKGYRYEFEQSSLYDDRIEASVTITPINTDE
jgi:methionyl-tRNA formyltransferase